MSNGIDFIIGGTDKAGPAMAQVEKSLARLEQKTDSLGKATSRLSQLTGVLAAGYAAVKAATAALGGLTAINAAYDKQADSVRGLETALRLQGSEVEGNSARLQAFAGDMQKLTGVGDEATIALMKQASMMGVSADQMESVTKASVGLSEVLGTGLEGSMDALRRAQEGNFAAFEKQFPQMKAMQSDAEKLAFVSELAAKGLDAKADASLTVSGMAERASGAIGDLMESVGALIAPVRILISQGIKTLAESLQTLLVPAVEYATAILENIGPMMDWVKEKVVQGVNLMIGAFTFFEVVIGNLDKIWLIMVSQAELYLLQMTEAVMHALTVVIPEYTSWFASNFVNMIKDAFMAVATVIGNAGTMIADVVKEMWQFVFVSMGDGTSTLSERIGAILSRGLTDGFESSITDLPDIAARKITEREKDLAATIGQVGANLGEEFSTKFAARMVGVGDGLSSEFSKDIDLTINKKLDDKLSGKSGGATGPLSASESRLLTRGPADKRGDLMEKILNKLNEIAPSLKKSEEANLIAASELARIQENTANTTQLVPTI